MKLDAYTSVQFTNKKQLNDSKNKSNITNNTNVSFKGLNVPQIGKKLMKSNSGGFSQKFGRFADESIDVLKQFYEKLF